ncbi:MAG: MFS transporter [Acidimicrobiales bacterium]
MSTEHRGGWFRRRFGDLASPLGIPAFRTVWAADVISLLGDWAARLALAYLVHERTGSAGWAAAVTAVSLAGFVGIGQVLATFADRYGRVTVMLVADVVRAAVFGAMLISMPIGALLVLAFIAGLATPPFEAARAAALPDLVPEKTYGNALALAGISVQASLVVGYALGGALIALVGAQTALGINAASFLVSAALVLRLRSTPASEPGDSTATMGRSLRSAAAELFGDRMIRRSLALVSVTGALGTVDEALVVPYADHVGISPGLLGLLAASVPIGTLIGTIFVPTTGSHERLLRGAAICAAITAAAAVPLYLMEISGGMAFFAFAISGGMFAVSIPTNAVIGTRLRRGTRASAMGIAVGVLMGSQALGAAGGGLVATWIGAPRAIAGALALAAVYSVWAAVTTPTDGKHFIRRWPLMPTTPATQAAPDVVIDLVALERQGADDHSRVFAS